MLQLQQGGIIEKLRNDVFWNQAKIEREDLRTRDQNSENNLVINFEHIISPLLMLTTFLAIGNLGFLGEIVNFYYIK